MITYKIAGDEDIELLMSSRLEMLRVVNGKQSDYQFTEELVSESREYFINGDQTTVLAIDDDQVIGCASISYVRIMPTFDHPTGKRAHLMNVYTRSEYRRQGIACKMVSMLLDEAWRLGVTEVSLDSTKSGRPLYQSMGFTDSQENMVIFNPKI